MTDHSQEPLSKTKDRQNNDNTSNFEMSNISEVKKLSLIRDAYKRKADALNESYKEMLNKKKHYNLQQAQKLGQLVDVNKSLLCEVDHQHSNYSKHIGQLVECCNILGKKIKDNQKQEEFVADNIENKVDALKKQLADLKNAN